MVWKLFTKVLRLFIYFSGRKSNSNLVGVVLLKLPVEADDVTFGGLFFLGTGGRLDPGVLESLLSVRGMGLGVLLFFLVLATAV